MYIFFVRVVIESWTELDRQGDAIDGSDAIESLDKIRTK